MGTAITIALVAGALLLVVLIFMLRRGPQLEAGGASPARAGDARPGAIEKSAEVLREILLGLAETIRRSDSTAGSSSQVLRAVRQQVTEVEIAPELADAQNSLLGEIDRVLSSNQELRKALQRAQSEIHEQERLIAGLQVAVRVDGLTGLANRTAFDEELGRALERLRRYQEEFSLVMLDIDHFKAINDRFGHPAGDRVLKGLAKKLKASLRGSDILARYGGEEFGAILPRLNASEAVEVADKLRDAVETSAFQLDEQTLRITISAGVSGAVPEDTSDTLLQRADEALYRAKRDGRNCVRSS